MVAFAEGKIPDKIQHKSLKQKTLKYSPADKECLIQTCRQPVWVMFSKNRHRIRRRTIRAASQHRCGHSCVGSSSGSVLLSR